MSPHSGFYSTENHRRPKLRNPAASTSSSTLVNDIDQKPSVQQFDPFDFHSTRHLTVCERPEGALPNRHALTSQLVHSSEQLSKILHQDPTIQYSPPSPSEISTNPSPPQSPSSDSLDPPNRIISHQPPPQPSPPQRKPRSSARDQERLQKLTNSPNKLNWNRITPQEFISSQLNPKVHTKDPPLIRSDIPSTSKAQFSPEESDPQAQTMAREDDHKLMSSDEQEHEETDSLEAPLEIGAKRLDAIFNRVTTAPMESLRSTNNSIVQKPQSTIQSRQESTIQSLQESTIQSRQESAIQSRQVNLPVRPIDHPKPKSRAPFEHLRGKFPMDPPSQETRQLASEILQQARRSTPNDLADATTQPSEPPANVASNHLSHPHPKPAHAREHLPIENHHSKSVSKPADDTRSRNPLKKTGWPAYPLLTPKKPTSDTDSPVDGFKSEKMNPKSDRTGDINDTFKQPITRHHPDTQKKVTFSKMIPDDDRGATGQTMSRNPLLSNTNQSENSNHVASQNHHPQEDSQDSAVLDSCSRLDAGQTTLPTPRMTGFYPPTPAPQPTPTPRLVSNEVAARRLAKLKNQTPRRRGRRLHSGLKDESDSERLPGTSALPGRSSASIVFQPYTSPNPKYIHPLPSSKRNPPVSSLKGKEKEVVDPNEHSVDVDQSGQVPSIGSYLHPHQSQPPPSRTDVYDETIVNPELTRFSSLQTPHPPGWLAVAQPSQTHSLLSKDRPAPLPSAMKQDRQKSIGSSRLRTEVSSANERMIYASNPSSAEFHNHPHPAHSHLMDDGTDDLTPRPNKRRQTSKNNHQAITDNKQDVNYTAMDTPKATHQTKTFSTPSFEGFNQDDIAHLTSTPAVVSSSKEPSAKSSHPQPAGPLQTVKELTSAVIEFHSGKNPMEALADVFSTANQTRLGKAISDAKHRGPSTSDRLDALTKSAEKIQKDRALIQSKLDQIHRQNTWSSRIFSALRNLFLPRRSPATTSRPFSWKMVFFGLVFQSLLVWLAFNLAAIRTYNYFIQVNAFSPMPIVQTDCYGRWSGPAAAGLERSRAGGGAANGTTARAAGRRRSGHEFFEGVAELAEFSLDWAGGFSVFFAHQARLLAPAGRLPPPSAPDRALLSRDFFPLAVPT